MTKEIYSKSVKYKRICQIICMYVFIKWSLNVSKVY